MMLFVQKIRALNPLCRMVNDHKNVCHELVKLIKGEGKLAVVKVKEHTYVKN